MLIIDEFSAIKLLFFYYQNNFKVKESKISLTFKILHLEYQHLKH